MSDEKRSETEKPFVNEDKKAPSKEEAPSTKDASTYRIRDWASI